MVEVADTPERVKPILCRICEEQFEFKWTELYAYTYTCPCGKVWGWVVTDPAICYSRRVEEDHEEHLVSVRRKERRSGGAKSLAYRQ